MHVFLEVRDSVDAAAEEAMRSVEEGTTPAEVRADPWFALRVAVHHDVEAEEEYSVPAKLSINVLAPLDSALYWLDGDIAGRRYVPVLPSRSELGGEVVPHVTGLDLGARYRPAHGGCSTSGCPSPPGVLS